MRNFLLLVGTFLLLFSCKETSIPKPKGYLSLQYPTPVYTSLALQEPYAFHVSNQAIVTGLPNHWLKITYPHLKATIDITYRPVENNVRALLFEAEKLVFEHTLRADDIVVTNFMAPERKVFASLHEITGNAASQLQFHATDSVRHFIKGSLYFYAKPNYDSILPAVQYLKKDITTLLETLEWE